MKKVISKVTYNTDTADFLNSKSQGNFGDESGYEEKLYVTKKGAYFLYCVGGKDSKYSVPEIIPLTEEEKNNWEKEQKEGV